MAADERAPVVCHGRHRTFYSIAKLLSRLAGYPTAGTTLSLTHCPMASSVDPIAGEGVRRSLRRLWLAKMVATTSSKRSFRWMILAACFHAVSTPVCDDGIDVIDHVVLGDVRYWSFKEA